MPNELHDVGQKTWSVLGFLDLVAVELYDQHLPNEPETPRAALDERRIALGRGVRHDAGR